MSTTETENYTDQKITTFTGKKVKWFGRAIRRGRWPEDGSSYSIEIYETKTETLVAWIRNEIGGVNDVVYADTDDDLIWVEEIE